MAYERVDPTIVERAIRRFAASFVVKTRRERAELLLLRDPPARRIEVLQALPGWLASTSRARTLTDADRQGLAEHRGILVDDRGACRVSLGGALTLSEQRYGALFVADAGSFAVLIPELGEPTLCRND